MKKILAGIVVFGLLAGFRACAGKDSLMNKKEIITPYVLSEKEQHLLEAFGMADNSQILSFCTPEEAVAVKASVYQLKKDFSWEEIGNGALYLDTMNESGEQANGTFAMEIREDRSMDFHINFAGQISFSVKDTEPGQEYVASTKGFLKEAQKIELNKEIPVAIMIYDNGTEMETCTVQDYFTPEKFKNMDLVQAVTLEFLDKELQ